MALIDERGPLSFTGLDMRSNALANGWRHRGLGRDGGMAILARNHRGLLDTVYATAKCGGRIILLNTCFGGTEIAQVVAREDVDLSIHDGQGSATIRRSLAPSPFSDGCHDHPVK